MDMASIGSAITAIRFAKDTVQTFVDSKIEAESQTKVSAVLEKLTDAQGSIYDMRDEMFRLQSENQQLHRDIRARDDWDARKAQYSLQRTVGGAVIYVSAAEPKHCACPVCIERHEVQILQPRGVLLDCPSCKATYQASPYRDTPIRVERAISSDNAWER